MVRTFVFNHYGVNCYVLGDDKTDACAIVDPACNNDAEFNTLVSFIEASRLKVEAVMLTHPHVDHLAGLRKVCKHYSLPAILHSEGVEVLLEAPLIAPSMGFAIDDMDDVEIEAKSDGYLFAVGECEIECRYTPGHCPGSFSYVVHRDKMVFTGDALFHFSVGRTDLPGGNYELLIDGIKRQILSLPDDYAILPGHDLQSMVWKERRYNPFLT
ncbi:MAG: MBL fold metallo-hydrolase [Bacteroidales bacterium]|nr:MBL fold metallo-hydrolase [Bacteroidales bacterium]